MGNENHEHFITFVHDGEFLGVQFCDCFEFSKDKFEKLVELGRKAFEVLLGED